MRRIVVIASGVLLMALLLKVCTGDSSQGEKAMVEGQPKRVISPEQLLHLVKQDRKPLRLLTVRDELPGGLSAAMAPAIIDWDASDVSRADGFVMVRNVNYGGNPSEGTTVLQTVKIPLDGVKRVEWILVPLGRGGRRAAMHHGQLRFVFHEDKPMQLVDLLEEDSGGHTDLYDIVVSWEAWRAAGEPYDVMRGMDPAAYALSLRLFAGPQRFLEDGLSGRDWFVTPLELPGGDQGATEVLKVALAMGDGLARHTLSDLFAGQEKKLVAGASLSDPEELKEQWQQLAKLVRPKKVLDDDRIDLPEEERTYQTVLRSCATVAYYNILVAVDRLAERGLAKGVDREHLDQLTLGGDEAWMKEVAEADMGGLVVRAPAAVGWLRHNPQAIPSRIPGRLHKAGLVRTEKGKPVEFHFSLQGESPYGSLHDNSIQ